MGFTQEEISDIRSAIPAQYRADPSGADAFLALFSDNAADERRSQINSATNDAKSFAAHDIERIEVDGKVASAQGPLTDPERAALTRALEGEAFDENRLAEISGTRAGYIETTGLGARQKETARLQAKARIQADARMQQLLALQASLNTRLTGLYRERGGLLGRHLSPGARAAIENLPEDQQKQAAIEAHKRLLEEGEITQEEYDAWLEDWERVNREIKNTKAELDSTHQMMAERSEIIQAKAATSGNDVSTVFKMNAQMSDDERDQRAELTRDAATLAGKTEDLENYKLELMNLEAAKGQLDYIAQIDEFLANAEPDVISEITNNPDKFPDIATRAALVSLKEQLSHLDGFKGTPQYKEFVDVALSTVSDDVRKALQNDPDLDNDLVAALYESYSDELVTSDKHTSTPDDKENIEDKSKIANLPPQTNHPGMG